MVRNPQTLTLADLMNEDCFQDSQMWAEFDERNEEDGSYQQTLGEGDGMIYTCWAGDAIGTVKCTGGS